MLPSPSSFCLPQDSQWIWDRCWDQKGTLFRSRLTEKMALSVQFSCSVWSDSLRLHGRQHARLPCPSPSPRACSNSCPLSQWYHPTISSSGIPFSSCLQSFPASGSLPMRGLFASGGQSIGASASVSVLPMNIQCWFPLGLTGLISLQSKGLSGVFSSTNSANSRRTTQIIFHVGWVAIVCRFEEVDPVGWWCWSFFCILDDFLSSCSVVEKRRIKRLNCNCGFVRLIV